MTLPRTYDHCIWPDDPCDRPTDSRGLCSRHYYQAYSRKRLDEFPKLARSGGKTRGPDRAVSSEGYVLVRDKNSSKMLLEHRVIMSESLGRPLRKGENVHHINGVRDDNRIENLELWAVSQPPGQRMAEAKHCPGCRCDF